MTKTDKVELISTVKSVYDRSNLTEKILRQQKIFVNRFNGNSRCKDS